MDEAAWNYVHGSQLVLDGTFRTCLERLLLFVAMGIDQDNHGVPVAFFLFSAEGGVKAMHGSYDRPILSDLLASWKEHLSAANGQPFEPLVAITDTDTRE